LAPYTRHPDPPARAGSGHNRGVSAAAVYPGDFPDPFVLLVDGTYYAYATNAGSVNVQVISSTDLINWQRLGDALPTLPGWTQPGHTWAPSVLPRGDGFVLYYTAREPSSGRQAISAATSSRPAGPFTDTRAEPLILQLDLGGSIDASPFVDGSGTPYLFWKADANALNQPSSLWGQELAGDGLSLLGTATQLLGYDAPWEDPLIEAPSVVYSDGTFFLFYSANWWASARYSVGYASGTDPLGPYSKVTTNGPWFASDQDVAGPGGQEFFADTQGGLHMAYHGWQPGVVGYPRGARTLRISGVTFQNGTPSLS
jgi:beta-xylosidase